MVLSLNVFHVFCFSSVFEFLVFDNFLNVQCFFLFSHLVFDNFHFLMVFDVLVLVTLFLVFAHVRCFFRSFADISFCFSEQMQKNAQVSYERVEEMQ